MNLPAPELVMFSVWLPRNTGYLLEEQGAWVKILPPTAFASLDGVAQWVGDGRTHKRMREARSAEEI